MSPASAILIRGNALQAVKGDSSISGMGVDLDNYSDNECSSGTDDQASPVDSKDTAATRRRFTRNAVIGSAVVFSLGNRAAWGQDVSPECLSLQTWGSYTPAAGGGYFSSMAPVGTDRYNIQKEKLVKADAIATAGIDENSPPGYVCPVPPQASAETDVGSKSIRTREKLGEKQIK